MLDHYNNEIVLMDARRAQGGKMVGTFSKKVALFDLQRAAENYKREYSHAVKECEVLQEKRNHANQLLKEVEKYVNSMANVPYSYVHSVEEIKIEMQNFTLEYEKLQKRNQAQEKRSRSLNRIAAAAGTGLILLNPAAAIAVAMTFGSTSDEISTSDMPEDTKTKATLKWLKRGTVTGVSIAGGELFLGLAGPVGWSICGFSLLGNKILTVRNNREILEKAEEQTKQAKQVTAEVRKLGSKVRYMRKETMRLTMDIETHLDQMKKCGKMDYELFTLEDKRMMEILMNCSKTLSVKIGEVVSNAD